MWKINNYIPPYYIKGGQSPSEHHQRHSKAPAPRRNKNHHATNETTINSHLRVETVAPAPQRLSTPPARNPQETAPQRQKVA